MKKLDLIGQKFGELIVIKGAGINKYGKSLWLCLCNCGKQTIAIGSSLINENTKSCGCLKLKHGYTKGKKSKTYKAWNNIVQRCTNPNDNGYKYYGGRNPPITVCDRWNPRRGGSFKNFLEDVGEIPKDKEIDRIHNDKGYNPNNFRLVTHKENIRNTRMNVIITFRDETHLLIEWSEILEIKYSTLYNRIYIYKWSIKKAFTTIIRKYKKGI